MKLVSNFPFFTKDAVIEILCPGGVLNSIELHNICDLAIKYNTTYLYFGERQSIYFVCLEKNKSEILNELNAVGLLAIEKAESSKNITSSLVSADIFGKNGWVSEGIIQDILLNFDAQLSVSVNIADVNQSLTALFNSDLNFVSSNVLNYWYLYIRNAETGKLHLWPELVYGTDIALVSYNIEEDFRSNFAFEISELFARIKAKIYYICLPITEDLKVPRYRFSYYEGMNRYENRYWLGIYRRKERLRATVLKEIATLIQETKSGVMYLSPWKSLVIKNIQEQDRIKWEMLLGDYGYNLRHSCSDLIWKTPDLDKRAYKIKKRIVRALDNKDVRTFGVTFGLKTSKTPVSNTSIIIVENTLLSIGKLKIIKTYSLYHTPDFNPNNPNQQLYRMNIDGIHLADIIKDLCKKYYAQLNQARQEINITSVTKKVEEKTVVHQCGMCDTVYDSEYGDHTTNILPGIMFDSLPLDYKCPVCSAGKEQYVATEMLLQI